MEKINFENNLLTNIFITELSRHRFCRWQTVDEALIGTNATYTYPKTLLINDFRRIALPSWHQVNLKGYQNVTVMLTEALEVPETNVKKFYFRKKSVLVDIMTIQPTKLCLKTFWNQKTYSVTNGLDFRCYIPLPPTRFHDYVHFWRPLKHLPGTFIYKIPNICTQ